MQTPSLSIKSVGHSTFASVGSSQRCDGSLGTSGFGSTGTPMANQHVPQCRHIRLPQLARVVKIEDPDILQTTSGFNCAV
ncbi:hypothetical protein PENNAL_c0124G03705 [Penicillium nalgiovense]|uniref:Uncharacterized protein n=1 Tax=Penicillium nalgiovense TaxID=60175 RepID=A0A1V6X4J4_PENNA|nr:hypothetical protein PENNAL_c0124G03705 [Penicillium nalgiovense]